MRSPYNSLNEGKSFIMREIHQMNEDLKYIGFECFRYLGECCENHLQELCQIINAFVRSRQGEKEKVKDLQRVSYNLEAEKNRLLRHIDRLDFEA